MMAGAWASGRSAVVSTVVPLLFVVALLAAAACGDDGSTQRSPSPAPSVSVSASPTPQPVAARSAVPGASATAAALIAAAPASFTIEDGAASYRVDMRTGARSQIMSLPPAIASNEGTLLARDYAVSRDGLRLAIRCDESAGFAQDLGNLCVFDGSTGAAAIVARPDDLVRPGYNAGAVDARSMRFSPDARWLLFHTTIVDARGERGGEDVYIVDVLNGGTRRIIENTGAYYMSDANWSPDSERFTIRRYDPTSTFGPDLLIVDPDTGEQTDMISGTGLDANSADAGAWSPDGTRIAFRVAERRLPIEGVPTELALYVASADGSGPRKLVTGVTPEYVGDLAWSPDGDWLAANLILYGDGDAPPVLEAHAFAIDGTEQVELAASGFFAWRPDSGTVGIWATINRRYTFVISDLGGAPTRSVGVDVAGVGPFSVSTEVRWNAASERIFYAHKSCGRGGCSLSPLYMLELNTPDAAQQLTDQPVRILD